jgi:hypothetical protein
MHPQHLAATTVGQQQRAADFPSLGLGTGNVRLQSAIRSRIRVCEPTPLPRWRVSATTVGGLIVAFGHGVAALGIGVTLVGLSGGMWPLLAAAVATEFGARFYILTP